MQIIRDPRSMQALAQTFRRAGHRIGVVPTMGYLHAGHLALVAEARRRADRVILTLFVNPTQFAPGEDLDRYPRDFERDERLCREAGVDVLFAPDAGSMYAPDASVALTESLLSRRLCGASRPTHFAGVLTVVAKLFNLTLPDVGVFGAKDAQQVRVIRRMVRDLDFPLEVVEVPTVREPDGLAMSSRNVYLNTEERQQALCLRRALDQVRAQFAAGERDPARLVQVIREEVTRSPLGSLDYAEIVDDESLQPVQRIERPVLVAIAVRFSRARLIDNTVLA